MDYHEGCVSFFNALFGTKNEIYCSVKTSGAEFTHCRDSPCWVSWTFDYSFGKKILKSQFFSISKKHNFSVEMNSCELHKCGLSILVNILIVFD